MSTTTDDSNKQFSVGTQWMIKDLTSETAKKFNGKTCVIVSTFDVTTGRVGVRIKNATNKGRTLNIKPINLHADQSTTLMEGVKDTTTQEAEDSEDCPQEAEDKEDCPICCDALPKLSSQFLRYTCCGKGLHNKCNADLGATMCMTLEQKNTCIMCRAKVVADGSKEDIERLRGWVKKGKGWAMEMLANSYLKGVGVKQSDKKAIELYEMAAKRGNATAQYNLGLYYEKGMHGLTQSDKRAVKYWTLAAKQGYANAQYNLGLMYARGEGIEQSNSKAREWWTKAAAQGAKQAIECLKIMDEKEGVKSTTPPSEVVDANIISCSTCGKQQTKEFRLGKCACRTKRYCNSQCQKKQYKQHKKECLRLVKERKKKNNGLNMKGRTKDGTKEKPLQEEEDKEDCPICTDALPKFSSQFIRLQCCGKGLHTKCADDLMENTSMTQEQKNTCIMCRSKDVAVAAGSKEDIEQLHGWAKKEKAWAMCMLADRYREGVGVKQSNKKAIELYETAAKRGHAGAQYNLGAMYAMGDGIETSYSKARELWTKAAAQGYKGAIDGLKQLDELGHL
jgi:TPR repeat protein